MDAGVIALVIACAAVLAAAYAVLETHNQDAGMRSYVAQARESLDEASAGSRATVQAMAEEVEHLIVRAREERARADGKKGGRPPQKTPEAEPNGSDETMTREEYLAIVERTGRTNSAIERRLFG